MAGFALTFYFIFYVLLYFICNFFSSSTFENKQKKIIYLKKMLHVCRESGVGKKIAKNEM